MCFNSTILTLGGVAVGCLLPDIDTPGSFLGRRVKQLSLLISSFTEHRRIVHSFVPIVMLLVAAILFKSIFILAISLGFLLHLVEDGFSKSGIRWLQPFSDKSIVVPVEWMRYKTGEWKEHIILAVAIIILLIEIRYGHFGLIMHQARGYVNHFGSFGGYHHHYRDYYN
ncbi:metal-dependent hydrolase [Clostridium massiliamazoniense]|uniref:metal-dependent hydrolase n=1 Tax=Clostridium massiliamazoniense TaxID=1347366 RepID=UPI000A7BA525|nr:metal-dependent hydrolase [Clostridium massiliamazoniense]